MNRIHQFSIFVFAFLASSGTLFSQSDVELLRLSQIYPGGTAQTIGLGGSFAMTTNPAAIASYRRNEIAFTFGVPFSTTTAIYDGTPIDETTTNFALTNGHIVFAKEQTGDGGWKQVNLGIGFNRTRTLSQGFVYEGSNRGSIVERWKAFANNGTTLPDDLYPFEEGLAYNTDLLYNDPTGVEPNTVYFSDLDSSSLVLRRQVVNRKGYNGSLDITVGGNFDNKIYVGAAIGVMMPQIEETRTYSETDELDTVAFFNSLTYSESINTEAVGINVKLGAIYRVTDDLRVGASIHTPTWVSFTDNFANQLDTELDYGGGNVVNYSEVSPDGLFEYNATTPWRAALSALYSVKGKGFLTAEVEYVDYAKMKFNLDPEFNAEEAQLNTTVQSKYTSAFNFRVGAEAKLNKFMIRGGYGYYGSPFQDGLTSLSDAIQTYSGGIGYRGEKFFIDLAYTRRSNSEEFVPYISPNEATTVSVETQTTQQEVQVGIGVRF